MRTCAGSGLIAVALLCGLCCGPHSAAATHRPPPELQPAVRIPVAPLGYLPPSSFYLTYRFSSSSLDFIDDNHILFTFHAFGLLRRLPSDQNDDADQEIRADVLDLRTGKVVRHADWRMHDHGRYLWALPDRKFLVRIRNSLFLTDQSLVLYPYLNFDSEILSVQVSPNRRLIVIEHKETPAPSTKASEQTSYQAPLVKVDILPPGSTHDLATSQTQSAGPLPLMGDGLLDLMQAAENGDWAVRFVPFHGEPHILAAMKSTCQPDLQPLSATAALIMGCYNTGDTRTVVAVSTADGSRLWQNQWANKYVWGWFTYAENGSRFAYESLEVNRPVSAFDALDSQDVAAQVVGVYDTDTGHLVLVRNATPVLTAGQNAALSPDGRRFAVLRHGAIEVYDLPPVQPGAAKVKNLK